MESRVLALEAQIEKMRLEVANDYLINHDINCNLCSTEDKMQIYAMLVQKANKFKKKELDKLLSE